MPRHFLSIAMGMTALCAASVPVVGQGVPVTRPAPKLEIPSASRPPSGMCRVWIDKVPAKQQPAPTDCASAIRNRPPNGHVIFSEQQLRPEERRAREPVRIGPRLPDSSARRTDSTKSKRSVPAKPRKKPPDPA